MNNSDLNAWIDPELEARVVAWVLGEASAFEAAELERLAAERPELAVFRRRIQAVHGLVGEAVKPRVPAARLSEERRTKLLAAIGGPAAATAGGKVRVMPAGRSRWRVSRRFIATTACVLFGLGLVFAVAATYNLSGSLSVAKQMRSEHQSLYGGSDRYVAGGASRPEGPADATPASRLEFSLSEPAPAPVKEAPAVTSDSLGLAAATSGFAYDQGLPGRMSAATPHEARLYGKMKAPTDSSAEPAGEAAKSEEIARKELAQETHFERRAAELASNVPSDELEEDRKKGAFADAGHAPPLLGDIPVIGRAFRGDAIATPREGSDRDLAWARLRVDESSVVAGDPDPRRTWTDQEGQNRLATLDYGGFEPQSSPTVLDDHRAQNELKPLDLDALGELAQKLAQTEAEPAARSLPFLDGDRFSEVNGAVAIAKQEEQVGKDRKPDSAERISTAWSESNLAKNLEPGAPPVSGPAAKPPAKPASGAKPAPPPAPAKRDRQASPELLAAKEPFSTFSLHVSDVSFRLAQAALAKGELPEPAKIRPEEFYNAFDYGDPAPRKGEEVACRIEQGAHPIAQQRSLVRIAMKVASTGRGAGQPLRLTVLLDTSGSMEREDRAASIRRAFQVLASLLGPNDSVTLVGFARTPRLLADRSPGNEAAKLVDLVARTPSEGGTNLEAALTLGGKLALRQFDRTAQNRVVLLTDGAANLGDADAGRLAGIVRGLRQKGVAFDACGVGAEGLNDQILEALTRDGDGRYYFLDRAEDADAGFARQLAGAFRPAARNVKVQVRFNPARVGNYRLIGFEKHRLQTEDFRNDKIDAAELAAQEAGVALYQVEVLPEGEGEIGEVSVRFRDEASGQMVERSWTIPVEPRLRPFDQAKPSLQLAGVAALLAEKLQGGPQGDAIDLDRIAGSVGGLRGAFPEQDRVRELGSMFEQTRRLTRSK
jgi:hypothetical protein